MNLKPLEKKQNLLNFLQCVYTREIPTHFNAVAGPIIFARKVAFGIERASVTVIEQVESGTHRVIAGILPKTGVTVFLIVNYRIWVESESIY